MTPRRIALSSACCSAVLALAAPRPADACGGCFAPAETITSVDSHRMVVSLSAGRTTLWDQIRYTGDPADFVWVLPVPSPATVVELADPLFFQELEAQTAPVVNAPRLPPLDCPPPPEWAGGAGLDAGAAAADADVIVFREETVGPYETVIIGSEDANALQNWLVDHNYRVPEETVPTIQHYVQRGSVFVVLRLAPGEAVNAMQPIRVRYPGYMGTFPLKMVTVGASGALELTLWVISDQRYESRNYATRQIRPEELIWDWNLFASNYAALFDRKIDEAGGRAWITEAAFPLHWIWFSVTDDVDVASVELKYPYVTRLRTRMLVDHLGDDLELQPASDVQHVSNVIQIPDANQINVPERSCPDWDGDGIPDDRDPDRTFFGDRDGAGCTAAGRRAGTGTLLAFAALAAIGIAARRAHRRARPDRDQ